MNVPKGKRMQRQVKGRLWSKDENLVSNKKHRHRLTVSRSAKAAVDPIA